MNIRIAINGFGRIGRSVFRILSDHKDIEVVCINDVLMHMVVPDQVAHQRRQALVHRCLKATLRATLPQDLVHDDGSRNALKSLRSQVLAGK